MRVRERWMVCRKSQVYRLLVVLIAVAVAVVGLAVLALQPYDVRRQIVLRYYISGAQSNFYCGTFATTAVSLIITVTTTTRGAVTATKTDLALLVLPAKCRQCGMCSRPVGGFACMPSTYRLASHGGPILVTHSQLVTPSRNAFHCFTYLM